MEDASTKERSRSRVCVAVRCRPVSEKESLAGASVAVELPSQNQLVLRTSKGNCQNYAFDHVFGPEATQGALFETLGSPQLDQAFGGYNSTIFAYGQTGSGKTHTMLNHHGRDEDRGLIPRICDGLFHRISELMHKHEHRKCLVQCSFMEVYNEVIHDLLAPRRKDQKSGGLEVKEQKGIGVYVKDLTETVVEDAVKLAQLVEEGMSHRATASTKMNDVSSRSHCIFTIKLHQKDTADSSQNTICKLNLVDLAGSERARDTGADGALLKEGANINKSLSALGNVINALSSMAESGKKRAFVPYRDSKLTRVLQESLGGNSFCMMVAAISPSTLNLQETESTLNYARRAKVIKVSVMRNAEAAQVKVMRQEVENLHQKIGVEVSDNSRDEERQKQELLEELEMRLKQTWEDKQKLSDENEEHRKITRQEAERLAAQMANERRRRLSMLEQHGDVQLTLQAVNSLGTGFSADWLARVTVAWNTWEQVQSQLRAVALYRESAGADLAALWQRCASTRAAGGFADADVAPAVTLLGQVRLKLESMSFELQTLVKLEAQAKEQAGELAPLVAVALRAARADNAGRLARTGSDVAGVTPAVGAIAGGGVIANDDGNEDLADLLELVQLQLQRQAVREEARLVAEMQKLHFLETDFSRLASCIEREQVGPGGCGRTPDDLRTAASGVLAQAVQTTGLSTAAAISGAEHLIGLLGLAAGAAPDARLRASSNGGGARFARLLQHAGFAGWCPRKASVEEFLDIDVSCAGAAPRVVVGVSVQGREPCTGHWRQTLDLLRMACAGDKEQESAFLQVPEKTFARPPVRLLHEVVMDLVNKRGCLEWDVADELLIYQSMSREHKAQFFEQLIQRVRQEWQAKDCGTSDLPLGITSADILAGKKCEEANRLLQMLTYLCLGKRDQRMGGLGDAGAQWVTDWVLEWYTKDSGWQWYVDPRAPDRGPVVFEGNRDPHTAKYVSLPVPIVATRLRLHPVKWHRFPALRCEVHLTEGSDGAAELAAHSLASLQLRDTATLAVKAVQQLHGSLEMRLQLHSKKEVDLKEQAAQEKGDLERRLQEALALAEQFEARSVAAEAALLHARADNGRLGAALRRRAADGSTATEVQGSLEARAAEKEKECLSLRAEVADLSEQLQIMKDERDVLRAHEEELEDKFVAKEEECMQANRRYVDLARKQEAQGIEEETSNLLADQLAQLSEEVRESQEAQEAAVKECSRLRADVAKLRTDNKALSSERDKLVRKKERLEAKKAEFVVKLATSEKARIAARDRVISLLERRALDSSPTADGGLDVASVRSGCTARSGQASSVSGATPKLNLNLRECPLGTPEHSHRGSTQTPPVASAPSPAFGGASRPPFPAPCFGFGEADVTPSQPQPQPQSQAEVRESRRKSKRDVRRDLSMPSLRSSSQPLAETAGMSKASPSQT